MDSKPKQKNKNNKIRNIVIDIVTFFVIAIVAIFIIILIAPQSGSYESDGESVELVGLKCSKSDPSGVFLSTKYVASSGEHQIRANFKDDKLTDLMYSFTAIFPASADIQTIKSDMNANFNIAYGNAYVHRDNLWSDNFYSSEEEHMVKMSVYAESGALKGGTAEVFGLSNSDENFPKTLGAVKSAYARAGYSCQVAE